MIGPLNFLRTIRGRIRSARLRRAGAFQPYPLTSMDRYPHIFGFVRDTLGGSGPLALLSFGCSTGEEVFTLRRYFPNARIKGVDVAPDNIKAANRALRAAPDAGLHFEIAASTAREATETYDAIFCMAVFRHGMANRPDVMRCDHLIRFDDFAHAIADIERCLKPAGLLVISFSNFRISDAPVAARFETILQDRVTKRWARIFGPDNRALPGVTYPDVVLRKLAGAERA